MFSKNLVAAVIILGGSSHAMAQRGDHGSYGTCYDQKISVVRTIDGDVTSSVRQLGSVGEEVKRSARTLRQMADSMHGGSSINGGGVDLNREINEEIDRSVLPPSQEAGNAVARAMQQLNVGNIDAARSELQEATQLLRQNQNALAQLKSKVSSLNSQGNNGGGNSYQSRELRQLSEQLARVGSQADYTLQEILGGYGYNNSNGSLGRLRRSFEDYALNCGRGR
ncbi:MAG: hypothetical protein SGI74_04370 [Oligoflexia bacterium]|nr:hypothetical protein [Oligoflexia bacterium]